jgi:hypothetical protein
MGSSRHLLASGKNNGLRSLSTLDQNIVTSPYPDITVPDVTLVDFVWDMVDKFPNYTALVSTSKFNLQKISHLLFVRKRLIRKCYGILMDVRGKAN